MEAVEREFARQVQSQVHVIPEIGNYLLKSGGKRVRPAVLLMSARLCGYSGPRAVMNAAVVEFIHTATLVHDDIIDDADVRRGRKAVHSQWGNDVTVLAGDFLYIKSMAMALTQDTLDIVRMLCDVTLRMIEGELYQLTKNGVVDLSEDEHFEIIRRKTAYLFGGCAQIGGMLGEVGAEKEQALREYGFSLGTMFQLVDDLLDFTGAAEALGKPIGGDLREGKITLPIIHLLENGGPEAERPDPQRGPRSRHLRRELGAPQGADGRASLDRIRLRPRGRVRRSGQAPAAPVRAQPGTRGPDGPCRLRAPPRPVVHGLRLDLSEVEGGVPSMSPAQRVERAPPRNPRHEELYYVHAAPEISDAEFDALMNELKALEAEHPELLTPDSPTQRVGGRPAEGFASVEHLQPMLSLDNAYDEDELRAFDERVRKGLVDRAVTRIRRRAEDRRPQHRADLRGRPAGARRHARRRHAR